MTNLRLLTVPQVMARTGLPRKTIYRLVQIGHLPAIKGPERNSPIWIAESALEAWVASAQPTAPTSPVAADADDDLPPVSHRVFA